jgi:DNA-directed RNA polymerase subunit beta'
MFIINKSQIAPRNVEISMDLAGNLAFNHPKFLCVLTCQTKKLVCQLCYGWSLAQGNLVPIGKPWVL